MTATALRSPTVTAQATQTPVQKTNPRYLFGTLLSSRWNAPIEYAAGVRVMHLELAWEAYEPQDGVFDAAYAAKMRERLATMRQAGMQVVLGVGLQYPPAWVYTYPHSRYVNQYGVAAGPVNLTFNQTLRQKAERYVARVHQDLDLNQFVAVRIGSGGLIEALYPATWDGRQGNSYWAYDAPAQGAAGRPPSIPPAPYPGWTPGERTYQGQAFTPAQVQQWYDWYVQALVDGIDWQIASYQRLGYRGDLQVLLPGQGVRPAQLTRGIESYLTTSTSVLGRAAVWHRVIALLRDKTNVVIYVSSMADGSGGDDLCQASDALVSLADPAVERWSATRWISYNATRYGLPQNGENPGRADTPRYGRTMLEAAARQMQACGFQGMMWAHAANLYDGVSGVSLDDYATTIARYSP
jgi:hypothetical protein